MTDNNVIWKINSRQAYLSSLFVVMILLIMLFVSFATKFYMLSFGFAIAFGLYVNSIKNLNILTGNATQVQVFNFWTKKSLYDLNVKHIKKIEVRFWSDLPGRTKIITFHIDHKESIKAHVLGVYMIDLHRIFEHTTIPIYIEVNNKMIRYHLKTKN